MNFTALATAIMQRCLADTGTGGLFNTTNGLLYVSTLTPPTKIYLADEVPPTLPIDTPSASGWPHVTIEVGVDSEQRDAFNADAVLERFRVHVWDHRRNGAGVSRCGTIIDRIFGDATLNASRVPTYGLHRHTLVLASGTWTGGVVMRGGSGNAHEEDIWHFIEEYTVFQERTAPGV